MQLRRLTQFSRIELEKEQDELQPRDRGARRDPRRRRAACGGSCPTSSAEVAKTFGTPAPHGPARVGRHRRGDRGRRAARGGRRPVLRAALLDRPARPHQQRRGGRAPAAPGPTTTWSCPRSAPPPAARSACSPSTGRLLRLGVLDLPAIPPSANESNLQGGVPLSELLSLEHRRARARAVHARHRRARARPRHPPGRGQAGQPRGPRQGRVGRHPPRRGRRGRRRGRAARPARRSSAS